MRRQNGSYNVGNAAEFFLRGTRANGWRLLLYPPMTFIGFEPRTMTVPVYFSPIVYWGKKTGKMYETESKQLVYNL